ncbi:hypothetical protein AVEN_87164-1 [Araneus ventricosus]|uniref:Uncharacterized protein n=1 Tax=Araneus ventricosus TaxID=182803 RepID=A0A4Y2GZH6_ARAVE|nr:hypothetical protein AVEN_87164-1 [Araneus ventricosus]
MNDDHCNSSSAQAGVLMAISGHGPTLPQARTINGSGQAQPLLYPPGKRDPAYCPTATRKTLNRVASIGRVEERRETGIKSTATLGKLSALRLARNSFSTEVQCQMRLPPFLSAPNEIKLCPSPLESSGISRFHNDRSGVWGFSRGDRIDLSGGFSSTSPQ